VDTRSFVATAANGEVAPIPVVQLDGSRRQGSTLSGHSGAPAYGLYLGFYYGLYGIADVTTLTGTEVTGK
jgi:hypothetical protein